ncbi:MAG: hypothetical protein AB7R89_23060 [Dehalococcoidia bacterium]
MSFDQLLDLASLAVTIISPIVANHRPTRPSDYQPDENSAGEG